MCFKFHKIDMPRTRYFVFYRVDPCERDFNALRKLPDLLDAFVGYTVEEAVHVRLSGFIMLRGKRRTSSQLCHFLPNFLVRAERYDSRGIDRPGKWVMLSPDSSFDDVRVRLFP